MESLSEQPITAPDSITNRELFHISLRNLSKRLPMQTSGRATFAIYLRWLEVHRLEQTLRTQHWSNTIMHWVQSLASRYFTEEQVIDEVHRWKRDNSPSCSKSYRHPPAEREIRKAFQEYQKLYEERKPGDRMSDHDLHRPLGSRGEKERERGRLNEGREGPRREEPDSRDFWSNEYSDRMERKRTDQIKYGGTPPSNYICNRCDKPGHYLQVCPTNMDPAYDRKPSENYQCEICRKRGDHFKSLCPKNIDPYSIIQKRKARGIVTTPSASKTHPFNDREREIKTPRDTDRPDQRGDTRLTTEYWHDSTASYNSPSPKKLEVLEKLQDIEDKKRNLFREQSEEIGDMIRESTMQRSSDRKRNYPGDESFSNGNSPTLSSLHNQRRKTRKTGSEGIQTPSRQAMTNMAEGSRFTSEGPDQDSRSDTKMTGYGDIEDNEQQTLLEQTDTLTRKLGYALRPIGRSPGSMISEKSDEESSDGMDIDERLKPAKEYSPFVQMLMQKRPEMREIANPIRNRKTACDMWEETDREQLQQSETRTIVKSPAWSPFSAESKEQPTVSGQVRKGEATMMQYDGACDDILSGDCGVTSMAEVALETEAASESQTFKLDSLRTTVTNLQIDTDISTTPLPEYKMEPATEHITEKPITSANANDSPTATLAASKVHFKNNENHKPKYDLSENRATLRKLHQDPQVNIKDLKAFSKNFKLSTPVPRDMENIMSNDPSKQKEIREKSDLDVHGYKLEKYAAATHELFEQTTSTRNEKQK